MVTATSAEKRWNVNESLNPKNKLYQNSNGQLQCVTWWTQETQEVLLRKDSIASLMLVK